MDITIEDKRVHIGPVLPLCDDISNTKIFVFGDTWWPRPKEGPVPDYGEWAFYWATPSFLRRFGIGVSHNIQRSIERERNWKKQDTKFKQGLNQLCGMLLQEDFIERAIINIEQERWQIKVIISRWLNGRKINLMIGCFDFFTVISDGFSDKIEWYISAGREKIKLFEKEASEGLFC